MLNQATLIKIKKYFTGQPDVIAVYLYGSHAQGQANVLSDVDLAVLLEKKVKNKFDRQLKFISNIQSIVGKQDADVKLLNDDYSLNYLHKVLAEGKLIYVKDKNKLNFFKEKITALYFDFKPVIKSYYQTMHKRIERGEYAAN